MSVSFHGPAPESRGCWTQAGRRQGRPADARASAFLGRIMPWESNHAMACAQSAKTQVFARAHTHTQALKSVARVSGGDCRFSPALPGAGAQRLFRGRSRNGRFRARPQPAVTANSPPPARHLPVSRSPSLSVSPFRAAARCARSRTCRHNAIVHRPSHGGGGGVDAGEVGQLRRHTHWAYRHACTRLLDCGGGGGEGGRFEGGVVDQAVGP